MNIPLDDSGKPVEGLYCPTPVTPEEAFQAIGRLRKEARDEIERLLSFLDQTDGDPDFEPSLAGYSLGMDDREGDPADTEPSLGWTDQEARWGRHATPADVDTELDASDDEPSLGSIDGNQEGWAAGKTDDREGDGCADDREGDELVHGGEAVHENDEPSLGWTDEEAARGRTYAGTTGQSADFEEGIGARQPQGRTAIDRPAITAVNTYRRFLGGLPADQKAAIRDRMRPDAKVSLT